MVFIRIKRVKGIPYAKLVRNVWKKSKDQPRQKLVKHLGRVYSPEKISEKKVIFGDDTEYKAAVSTLMRAELLRHGFKEADAGLFEKDFMAFNIISLRSYDKRNGKRIILSLNKGLFCEENLSKVFNFSPEMEIGKQPGSVLSHIYEKAGFNPKDTESFIMIYTKSVEKEKMTLDEFKKKFL